MVFILFIIILSGDVFFCYMFSRDSDNKLLPAAALASEHSKGASSIAITALMEEKVDFAGFNLVFNRCLLFCFDLIFCFDL